jgi:regulator of replication initiation timing
MTMNCLKCAKEFDFQRGTRKFCSDACRQAYWRQQHQADQDAALLAELEQLRTHVITLEQENAEQAQEIAQLRSRLDYERRYLSDIKPRYFKTWLKKQPASPFVARMFADPLFPARGPRSLYEAHTRRLHLSEEEHDDFVRLWKLMLLQS